MSYLKCLDNDRLVITAGNSVIIDITPIDEETGAPIILGENDKVLFTVKSNLGFTKIQKTLTSENYSDPEDTSVNCVLDPDDTIELEPGEYVYDCLLYKDNNVTTFISSTICIKKPLGKYTDLKV